MIWKALQTELFRIKMDSAGVENPKIPGIKLKRGSYDIYVAVKGIQQDLCYGISATGAYFIINILNQNQIARFCSYQLTAWTVRYGTVRPKIRNNEWILSRA